MLRFLTRQSKSIAFMESLVVLFVVAWLDLITDSEISLVLLYAAPIILTVLLCDNKTAFLMAGLSGVIWSWADNMSGHLYPNSGVQAWETLIRFVFFFLVALAAIAAKEKNQATTARIRLLEHARNLEKQIIEVSEYEQQRIGRDLHDGLCQYLAAIGCAAKSLKMDLEQKGLDQFATTAAEIEKLLNESVKQARNLSHGLVPVQLDEAGLPAALQELAASTSRLLATDCTFEFAGDCKIAQHERATHLYRIAQEAINNATKHGKAQNVEVKLSGNSSAMSLSIADDGTGFLKTEKALNGVGISIMRYRANIVGGDFEIEERPNGGTVVSCTVPAEV